MAYGHAGRVLAAIRLLAVQTGELLASLAQLGPEQWHRRQKVHGAACRLHRGEPAQDPIAKIAKPALRERVSSPPREMT